MARARVISDAILKMRAEALLKRDASSPTGGYQASPVASEAQAEPIIVKAVMFTGAMIITSSERNPLLLEVMRTTPGRAYRGDTENMIPLIQWKSFVERVEALPGGVVKIAREIAEVLDWHVNAPNWHISLASRWIIAKYGPQAIQMPMYQVAGAEYRSEEKCWRMPLDSGWKLYKALETVDGVVYDDEAQALILGQVEARAKLDKIAKLERGDKYRDYDFGIGLKLREFQEVGCEFTDAAGGRVIIADEMGLGKTWQALAYAIKNGLRTVVICPASLKANWAREIKKLSNGYKPTVLEGSEPSQYTLIKFITEPPKFAIINYDILGRKIEIEKEWTDEQGRLHEENQTRFLWVELINMSKPDLVIVDEGHYIKNVDSNRSIAVRKLKVPKIVFMTGTPVLNRPGELWPMLTMIAPEQFPAHETFLSQYTYDGKTAKNVDELRTLMRPIMIRRLKKDVVKELPPINRINEYHELSPKALKLYRKVEQGIYQAIEEYSAAGRGGQEMGITNILAQIMRLKMVCAIDKADATAELARQLYEETDETGNRKVIIFTQFKGTAYAIWQRLADDGALCFVTRGASDFTTADSGTRDELVQRFQTDPSIKYLVVTEKTTKEGHNITAAGHVIFNDLFWTPAGHEQAEGRAYGRLSNLHSINSYYMITDMDGESIEEWIMDLLASKMKMINEVVEGVEKSRDVSVVMELIAKMKGAMWTRKR